MTPSFVQNIGAGPFIIFSVVYFAVWVYCLVDILRSNFKDPNMKMIWIVIIVFAQFFGPIIYLAMGKSTKTPTF